MTREIPGRRAAIWAQYVAGTTQRDLAKIFEISLSRVTQILASERAKLGIADRAAILNDLVRDIQADRDLIDEMKYSPLPPAFSVKGDILFDEQGVPVRDPSGRLAAIDRGQRSRQEMSRLLGLNAPDKQMIDTTVRYRIDVGDEDDGEPAGHEGRHEG